MGVNPCLASLKTLNSFACICWGRIKLGKPWIKRIILCSQAKKKGVEIINGQKCPLSSCIIPCMYSLIWGGSHCWKHSKFCKISCSLLTFFSIKNMAEFKNLANFKLVQIVAILFLYSRSAYGRISMLIWIRIVSSLDIPSAMSTGRMTVISKAYCKPGWPSCKPS